MMDTYICSHFGHFSSTCRYVQPKETPLEDLIKFIVVALKGTLRTAKIEAKRFCYTLLVSLLKIPPVFGWWWWG